MTVRHYPFDHLVTMHSVREQILDAARKLIARHGFEATSTKAIAAEAGVPSGLVFYYFETKDDLIEALFSEKPRLVEDAIRIAQRRPQPLEAFLRALYDDMVECRHLVQIIVAAIASDHPIADVSGTGGPCARHYGVHFYRRAPGRAERCSGLYSRPRISCEMRPGTAG
jgi:AcrR family transcriptional regulator